MDNIDILFSLLLVLISGSLFLRQDVTGWLAGVCFVGMIICLILLFLIDIEKGGV